MRVLLVDGPLEGQHQDWDEVVPGDHVVTFAIDSRRGRMAYHDYEVAHVAGSGALARYRRDLSEREVAATWPDRFRYDEDQRRLVAVEAEDG